MCFLESAITRQIFTIFHELAHILLNTIAERYHVSREVILRKLHDKGLVANKYYEVKSREWAKEYEENRKEKRGGNYYHTQFAYLGENFLKLAFSK